MTTRAAAPRLAQHVHTAGQAPRGRHDGLANLPARAPAPVPHAAQDEDYKKAGATIAATADALGQDVVLKVGHAARMVWHAGRKAAHAWRPCMGRHAAARGVPCRLHAAARWLGYGARSPHARPARPPCPMRPFALLTQVRPPSMEEIGGMKRGARLISYIYPSRQKELVDALAEKKMTVIGALRGRLLHATLC